MYKSELRQKYKILRQSLGKAKIEKLSVKISKLLLTLPLWKYKNYHLFVSIEEQMEIDTKFILNTLQSKDKNIIIPKTDFKTQTLTHILLSKIVLIKKCLFYSEPKNGIEVSERDIDVVFVPLLAFDQKGNRVGYGKGFYDRFLGLCRSDVIKVGLSFFKPEDSIDNIESHDICLDYCVTPYMVYKF